MMSRRVVEFVLLTLGSYVGYIVYSIYQEKIFKTDYLNSTGTSEKFTYPSSSAIFPALCCYLVGTIRRIITKEQTKMPIKQQIILGGLYSVILFSINSALIYLTYPTQLILGNLRLLVIFLVGKFCSRIKNKADSGHNSKFFIGMFITFGIFMFNYQSIVKSEGVEKSNYLWGVMLMMIFLLAEGFLVDSQSFIKINYSPSSNDLFTSTNKLAFLFSLTVSLLLGEFLPIINFIFSHEGFGKDLLIFCIFGTMGQFFMYEIIKKFEPYLYAIMTVFRKILMVVISIILYGHRTTGIQIVGMVVVFSGLIYEVRNQMMQKKVKL